MRRQETRLSDLSSISNRCELGLHSYREFVGRIHYEIPDDLHRRAKAVAAMRGITLKDFLIQLLAEATKEEPPASRNR